MRQDQFDELHAILDTVRYGKTLDREQIEAFEKALGLGNAYLSFQKIPRLANTITITEKVDGTNGLVEISEGALDSLAIRAGSRNRWLTQQFYPGCTFEQASPQGSDNYGFGRWVCDNAHELVKLGPGKHYGEWYGSGIQRGYGLRNGDKRFALFNPSTKPASVACVEYVPILFCGTFEGQAVEEALHELRRDGSKIVPGFMNPEGIVLRFSVNGVIYKAFCEDDGLPKGVSPDNPY